MDRDTEIGNDASGINIGSTSRDAGIENTTINHDPENIMRDSDINDVEMDADMVNDTIEDDIDVIRRDALTRDAFTRDALTRYGLIESNTMEGAGLRNASDVDFGKNWHYPYMVYDLTTVEWQFRKKIDPPGKSLPCRIPTNIHLDLFRNNVIPDPFSGYNELQLQWIEEREWIYSTKLPRFPQVSEEASVVLAFDGLDTVAHVYVNGTKILRTRNQFVSHRVDVKNMLKGDGSDILEINFLNAEAQGLKLVAENPDHLWHFSNGEASRLAIRKAQYHWGWDWGPRFITCGPWKPIRIEIYQSRITDLFARTEVSEDLKEAKIVIEIQVLKPQKDAQVFINVQLNNRDTVVEEMCKIGKKGIVKYSFSTKPQLWYPIGYGEQPLYTITATIIWNDMSLHTIRRRIGLRRTELVQQDDKHGKSFFFRINNIDIFCGGSNWIPAQNFTPVLSESHYRKYLQLVADGNQVMLRVWGGGIYESDIFYDICDELGILVWQDFMFACGNYPTLKKVLNTIREECMTQLTRLRRHPCIVLYCGNNEDYQIQEQFDLTYDYEDKNPENWLKTDFPARYIYEKLLPDVVEEMCPGVPYHPGSPWGDGKRTSDKTVGDVHVWDVWHGAQQKYQMYDQLGGRFNSEFGMQAFPHLETIRRFVTDSDELYPQSRLVDFHNKAVGHDRRIACYVEENFRVRGDLEGYIYLTQMVQAEAMLYAYRGWRRQWGQERRCGGALCWQLNDCWPAISWSIIDVCCEKKPAYWVIKRTLKSIAVGVQRHPPDNVQQPAAESIKFSLWACSSKMKACQVDVEVRIVSIGTGKDLQESMWWEGVTIDANGTTELFDCDLEKANKEPFVIVATLWDGKEVIARDVDWPQPYKYLSFEDRGLKVKFDGQTTIKVKAKKPVKGLVFEDRVGLREFSDNCLDIIPGHTQYIQVTGLTEDDPLPWRHLGTP